MSDRMGSCSDSYSYTRKFRIIRSRSWAWHIGLFFCIEPKQEITGSRDIYLFLCLGTCEISVGMLTEYEDGTKT